MIRRERLVSLSLALVIVSSLTPVFPAVEAPSASESDQSDDGPYILKPASGDTLPSRVEYRQAKYPEELRKLRLESALIVQVVVHRSGAVDSFTLLSCEVHRKDEKPEKELRKYCAAFESAAEKALGKWRYEPGLRQGKPVDAYFTIGVNFRLRE